jgi:hypothetical protein
MLWCENATKRTGNSWVYALVRESDFHKLKPDLFADLLALQCDGGLFAGE